MSQQPTVIEQITEGIKNQGDKDVWSLLNRLRMLFDSVMSAVMTSAEHGGRLLPSIADVLVCLSIVAGALAVQLAEEEEKGGKIERIEG